MPKRPRQAHIPSQVRRRKPRKTQDFSASLPPQGEAAVASEEAAVATVAGPRVGRRMAAATQTRESGVSRSAAGQLPTFDRVYLKRELTQIAIVSGSLLLVLLMLWLVMR